MGVRTEQRARVQLAVPGWPLVQAARLALWDELTQRLEEAQRAGFRPSPGEEMLVPRELGSACSAVGESLVGLICAHNEDCGEDPAAGSEEGCTPLGRQLQALGLVMRGAGSGPFGFGLPPLWVLERECRRVGLGGCFVYRAVCYASAAVALRVLQALGQLARHCAPGVGYRLFFERHGERLLLACVQHRDWRSLPPRNAGAHAAGGALAPPRGRRVSAPRRRAGEARARSFVPTQRAQKSTKECARVQKSARTLAHTRLPLFPTHTHTLVCPRTHAHTHSFVPTHARMHTPPLPAVLLRGIVCVRA